MAYADIASDGSTFAPGINAAATNNTTPVTVAGSPAASQFRQVKYLSVYNADTEPMTVSLSLSLAGTPRMLIVQTLVPGARLEYTDGHGFKVMNPAITNARATVSSVSSVSGVVTLDWSLGDYFLLELTENVTSWVIDNPPGAGLGFSLMVEITQGAGPYTVAKPDTVPGGVLAVSTDDGAVDLLAISSFDNGATLRSNLANDYT